MLKHVYTFEILECIYKQTKSSDFYMYKISFYKNEINCIPMIFYVLKDSFTNYLLTLFISLQ